MLVHVGEALRRAPETASVSGGFQFPNVTVDTDSIRVFMINEVVPENPDDDFYGNSDAPQYLSTTIPLFQLAGAQVGSVADILARGIYITNAVKRPKIGYTIPVSTIEESLPMLEQEVDLFPNLAVIMLMGDVAKKAFNMIAKRRTGKRVIPAISTYKLRSGEFYYGPIRVLPSYIMTGGNILIEKSKVEMASEDIRRMLDIIK